MSTQRTYAPAAIECGGCGEVVELQVPVDVTVGVDEGGDGWIVRAVVNDDVDWEQPMWQHALDAHGPRLD